MKANKQRWPVTTPGFYILLRDPAEPKVTHVRFERTEADAQKCWRDIFGETKRQASIVDTDGTVHHNGPAAEAAVARQQ